MKAAVIAILTLLFATCATAQEAPSTSAVGTYGVALDHLILETTNIDSVSQRFRREGLEVRNDDKNVKPVDTLVLNHRTRIEIRQFSSYDSSDAPFNSLSNYYSTLVFRTDRLSTIEAAVKTDSFLNDATFRVVQDSSRPRALAIGGGGPLDIVFAQSPLEGFDPDTKDRNRIDWLVLTAGETMQRRLTHLFALLKLTRHHEGCCDYWLIGPPDERMKIRFDFDHPQANPEWLSIEAGGVIFAR